MDKKQYLSIRKLGLFYNAFDEDAHILHYLLGYKVINGRCGFPSQSYDKVINILEEKKIDYVILGEERIEKTFKDLNNYDLYLCKSKNKLSVMKMVAEISSKIEQLSEEQLNEVLVYLKKIVDEKTS